MKPAPFDDARPADWPAAPALLAAGARPVAGGQSLGPMLNLRVATPEKLADLRHLPGYAGVTRRGGAIRIGAGTTHAAIEDGAVPGRLGAILAGVAWRIAYRPVRNRGTIGGSLAHADPAADWVAVLPCFHGEAAVLGPAGERRVALDRFVTGMLATALAPEELLLAVELPVLPEATR
ncbi:FAD binding domain-containing protein [Siccirubricoccus sp. KC 17139]|uniref:FAD binding domain-containing protein n=1 Tax=Siccirubricoccus soli TaxID=2899147 RepID=A0ABT1D746_9PROT|nr:FAD binding domain-containing protein [Siccirubricoccus soli]MCO6417070.1 FAD binding domain-containing protein [Siccirubricoccus soli]MCP2683205.1 FAD binding domain-containing protein [Siccirubricoccus soli]